MNTMSNLLLLYAGLLVLNTVIAAILWRIGRTSLHRDLLLMWSATVVAFVAQGAASQAQDQLIIVYAFATVFLVNFSLARLLAGVMPVRVPVRGSLVLFSVSFVLAHAAAAAGAPFALIALPVSVGVSWPLLAIAWPIFTKHWPTLSFTGKGMAISSMVRGADEGASALLKSSTMSSSA